MAPKRPLPKKPASRKPLPVAKTVDEPVIRRNTVLGTLQSPVEARAEREPAVVVAPSVAEIAAKHEVDVWAVPPQQMSWWERLRALLGARKSRKAEQRENMAEHMAAVKAGVLQELETMGAKKGIAIKGSPFSTVMLPVATKKRNYKWPLVGAVVLAMIILMVWIGRQPADPNKVLGQAIAAVREHDVRTFEAKVDIASVATSVVNQMLNVQDMGTNPMAARMTAFVKPGLAESLKDEILAAVGGEKLDDSGNTLLGKLWHALGGKNARFGAPRVAMESERLAVAELPIMRADLGLNLPLQVVMTQDAGNDGWQVVDMPNLGAVLGSITAAERVLDERRAAVALAALPGSIKIENVKKAKDGHAGGSNLMVSMILANKGLVDAKDVQLEVAFGDAAGQPMMTTRLTLDGTLAAGGKREQVWSVPVDRARAAERYVADLPLSALSVTVTVVQ